MKTCPEPSRLPSQPAGAALCLARYSYTHSPPGRPLESPRPSPGLFAAGGRNGQNLHHEQDNAAIRTLAQSSDTRGGRRRTTPGRRRHRQRRHQPGMARRPLGPGRARRRRRQRQRAPRPDQPAQCQGRGGLRRRRLHGTRRSGLLRGAQDRTPVPGRTQRRLTPAHHTLLRTRLLTLRLGRRSLRRLRPHRRRRRSRRRRRLRRDPLARHPGLGTRLPHAAQDQPRRIPPGLHCLGPPQHALGCHHAVRRRPRYDRTAAQGGTAAGGGRR